MKSFSEACERNREPILAILKRAFADRRKVLEIGSGTGQHAAYFARSLEHLVWQPSDVADSLPSIAAWAAEAGAANLAAALELDVDQPFPGVEADAVFSANTCHIMSWRQVERMFAAVGSLLPEGGVFALYGPFNYGGQATSASNAAFDASLRRRDAASGLRDAEAIVALAARHQIKLEEDCSMPANNRLLLFRRQA
jgi:SAM-dependent methyltransferase